MNLNLKNKVAIITGSSSGLGKVIAQRLAESGAHVLICARTQISLNSTISEFKKNGLSAGGAVVNVKDPAQVKRFYKEQVSKLDILINNVGGVEKFGSFMDLEPQDWSDALALNLMSMVYFSQEAIPYMKKSGSGRIVNISSVPAIQPGFFNPHYSAAKAAMVNLSKHLSNFLAKDNVLVNAVCPSTLSGGGWDRNINDKSSRLGITFDEAEKLMAVEEGKKVPLGRVGTVDDVANLVTFLCSEAANFITGESISVDGGTTRSAF